MSSLFLVKTKTKLKIELFLFHKWQHSLKVQYVGIFHHKRAQIPMITKAKLDDAVRES